MSNIYPHPSIGIGALFTLLYHDNPQKYNILSKVQENVAGGEGRGVIQPLLPLFQVVQHTMYNARWPFSVVHQSSCQLNVDQGYKIDAFICMWCEPLQVPAQVLYTCTLDAVRVWDLGAEPDLSPLEWFKECARYIILILGTGDRLVLTL